MSHRRQAIDCGDGVEVHFCAGDISDETRRALISIGRAAAEYLAEQDAGSGICGRIMVGSGTDTYDPLCELQTGHDGPCKSCSAVGWQRLERS